MRNTVARPSALMETEPPISAVRSRIDQGAVAAFGVEDPASFFTISSSPRAFADSPISILLASP